MLDNTYPDVITTATTETLTFGIACKTVAAGDMCPVLFVGKVRVRGDPVTPNSVIKSGTSLSASSGVGTVVTMDVNGRWTATAIGSGYVAIGRVTKVHTAVSGTTAQAGDFEAEVNVGPYYAITA